MKKIIFYTTLFICQYMFGNVFSVPDRVAYINNPANYISIYVSNPDCTLLFPQNGTQPTTQEAGLCSGARNIGNAGDAMVTEWYVRAFGGNNAVVLATDMPDIIDNNVCWGFGNRHIIQADPVIAQQFWQAFLVIAQDPVGRVLLYRLLIEIRRLDHPNGNGCCENGIALLNARNNVRTVYITANPYQGFSFNVINGVGFINFDPNRPVLNTIRIANDNNTIDTYQDNAASYDICLFHELLHWFHFLRHPNRFFESKSNDPALYRYLLRSYYGDLSELYTWGSIDDEELRTILGSPDYNNEWYRALMSMNAFVQGSPIPVALGLTLPANASFFNGDDLSENAYRLSRNEHGRRTHMRFGHGACINPCHLQRPSGDRFWLAHRVAIGCYHHITGVIPNWPLRSGGAAQ